MPSDLFYVRYRSSNLVIIPKVYLVPEAKPRDTNIPRVLLLLVNDSPNLLVPKVKPRNTNSISNNYLYSANMPNHLLMIDNAILTMDLGYKCNMNGIYDPHRLSSY